MTEREAAVDAYLAELREVLLLAESWATDTMDEEGGGRVITIRVKVGQLTDGQPT
jgi:hypothetical protein